MDSIVEAIKELSNESLENDRALFKLCNALVDRVLQLEERVRKIENEEEEHDAFNEQDE